MSNELEVVDRSENALQSALEPQQISDQIKLIQRVMKEAMKEDEHFGTIPGCGKKKALLKPGAEKLSLLFQLSPSYKVERADYPNGHREYEIICTLTHIPSQAVRSEGVGACTTMESKYRFRNGEPQFTDTPVPSGYWDLKKLDHKAAQDMIGGRGHIAKKNDAGQWMIAVLADGKVEHDNPADYYNTVLKMAKKRAYIDAMLSATAASDIFVQDMEDVHMDQEHAMPSQGLTPPQQQPMEQSHNQLHDQAWAMFDKVKHNLNEEGRNWAMNTLNAGGYQDVINWLKGGQS